MPEKFFDHTVPFLPVRDLKQTIDYYRDTLGFSGEWFWEDTDAGIERDDMAVLFNHNPSFVERVNTGERGFEVMWFVQNVDEIYEEYQEKGVKIVGELKDEPWGVREFAFTDINGYYIRVAEGIGDEDEEEIQDEEE